MLRKRGYFGLIGLPFIDTCIVKSRRRKEAAAAEQMFPPTAPFCTFVLGASSIHSGNRAVTHEGAMLPMQEGVGDGGWEEGGLFLIVHPLSDRILKA